MFDQSFVRRVAFRRKNCIFLIFVLFAPPPVRICACACFWLCCSQRAFRSHYFCLQVRVNGGRYIDLLRSRCAELRAVFASFDWRIPCAENGSPNATLAVQNKMEITALQGYGWVSRDVTVDHLQFKLSCSQSPLFCLFANIQLQPIWPIGR